MKLKTYINIVRLRTLDFLRRLGIDFTSLNPGQENFNRSIEKCGCLKKASWENKNSIKMQREDEAFYTWNNSSDIQKDETNLFGKKR